MLDNTLEFLVMNGMDLPLAVMVTIPEPWANDQNMSREKRDFYQYYATMMEPWDGPASILFSRRRCDGRCAGPQRSASLPLLYHRRRPADPFQSEVGVLDIPPKQDRAQETACVPAKCCWWIRPGAESSWTTTSCKEYYASRQPYGEWLDSNLVHLKDLKIPNERVPSTRAGTS